MDIEVGGDSSQPVGSLKKNKFSVSKVASPALNPEIELQNGDAAPAHDEQGDAAPQRASFFLVDEKTPDAGLTDEQRKAFKVTKVAFDVDDENNESKTNGAPPQSPTNSYMAQSYDTHNLKTFGHDTLETLPNVDHYRNLLSATGMMKKRPTLAELHDMQVPYTFVHSPCSHVSSPSTHSTSGLRHFQFTSCSSFNETVADFKYFVVVF